MVQLLVCHLCQPETLLVTPGALVLSLASQYLNASACLEDGQLL